MNLLNNKLLNDFLVIYYLLFHSVTQLKDLFNQDGISTISIGIGAPSSDVEDYVTGHFAQNGPILTNWAKLNTDNTLKEMIGKICTT